MFDVDMLVWFVVGLIAPTSSAMIIPTASGIIAPTASESIAGGNPLDFPQTPFEQGNTASLVPLDPSPDRGLCPWTPPGLRPWTPLWWSGPSVVVAVGLEGLGGGRFQITRSAR